MSLSKNLYYSIKVLTSIFKITDSFNPFLSMGRISGPDFLLPSMGRFLGRMLMAFCSLNYSIVFKAMTAKLSLQICKSVNQSLIMVSVYS